MKVAILSCMWQRKSVFRIFAQSMKRIKKFDVLPLIVGSEGSKSKSLAKEYGLAYIEYPNAPLGAKFNAGMKVLRGIDYVMVLGSDDIISDSYMELFLQEMHKGYDVIGTIDAYYYSPIKKELGYWGGYETRRQGETIGMGRTLSKRVLDKLDWTPWRSDINKGLDGSMTSKLSNIRLKQSKIKMIDTGIMAVDIKIATNITSYGCFPNLEIMTIDSIKILPEWKQIIKL